MDIKKEKPAEAEAAFNAMLQEYEAYHNKALTTQREQRAAALPEVQRQIADWEKEIAASGVRYLQ